MRALWIGIIVGIGCLALPESGQAQARAGDVVHMDIGLRVGGFTGLTGLGRARVTGFEEPHWREGELGSGLSAGGVLTVEPTALPVAFRATADWVSDAPLPIETFGCGAGPETSCGRAERVADMFRAVADVLWYAAPGDARWRPFFAGGLGVARLESRRTDDLSQVYVGGGPTEPFVGVHTDPTAHAAAGIDLQISRIRVSAEAGAYTGPFVADGDQPEKGWNTIANISLGARVRIW